MEHVYDSLNGRNLARARQVDTFARNFINSSRGNRAGRNNKLKTAAQQAAERRRQADFKAALAQALAIADSNDNGKKPVSIHNFRLDTNFQIYDLATGVIRDGHQSDLQTMLAEVATWNPSDVKIKTGNSGWTIYPFITPSANRAFKSIARGQGSVTYGKQDLSASGRIQTLSGHDAEHLMYYPLDKMPRPQPINRSGWAI